MRSVRREMRIARAILAGSSSMRTTSAASMAASLPKAPMAMPMSARASTGASLIPSPTKARSRPSLRSFSSRSTCRTLSAGSSWLWTSSTPSWDATCRAAASASPVSITVFSTPSAFRPRMAWAACSLTTSPRRIHPAYTPSTATYTTVPALWGSIG